MQVCHCGRTDIRLGGFFAGLVYQPNYRRGCQQGERDDIRDEIVVRHTHPRPTRTFRLDGENGVSREKHRPAKESEKLMFDSDPSEEARQDGEHPHLKPAVRVTQNVGVHGADDERGNESPQCNSEKLQGKEGIFQIFQHVILPSQPNVAYVYISTKST